MGNTCVGAASKTGFFEFDPESSTNSNSQPSNEGSAQEREPEPDFTQQKPPPENHIPPVAKKSELKEAVAAMRNGGFNLIPGQSFTQSVLQRQTENLKDLYTLGRKLGQGQFGTTYLCIEKATGKEYACKSIAKRKLISQEDVDDVRRELHIMHHLSGHPNIVTIKGAYEDSVSVHLVMELCAGGELFDRIIQRGHYSEAKAAELTRVIVGVVEACHSLGVMHRDLKPENFLLSDPSENAALKTTDFGLSVFFKPGEVFSDVVGSPYYVAPEVLRKHYGPEADVWSAGVILYILLSGVPPFWAETEQGIFEQVLKGDLDFISEPWPNVSESAKDLIRKMLNPHVSRRLKAHEVLSHPWIREDGVAPDRPIDPAVQSRLKQFSAMNKLKKVAIRVIAESLSEEEIAGLKEMFKMMDTDNSGSISFEELQAGLHKVGSNLMESEIRQLMDAADVDQDGTIDYGEFMAATLHLNKIEREENLFAAFSWLDKDHSGYLTTDELQQACVEYNMGETCVEDLIREVDQDNDGRIDYNEFVTMMRKGNGGVGRATLRNSLSLCDSFMQMHPLCSNLPSLFRACWLITFDACDGLDKYIHAESCPTRRDSERDYVGDRWNVGLEYPGFGSINMSALMMPPRSASRHCFARTDWSQWRTYWCQNSMSHSPLIEATVIFSWLHSSSILLFSVLRIAD